MNELVERLMLLAAPKKKVEYNKYTKDAENALDELLAYVVEVSDYTKNDRAFRLLMRLRKALEAEGYGFREKVMQVSPSTPSTPPKVPTGKTNHLLYSGAMCTLLKAKPPAGLDLRATVKLMEYIGSKQCFRFTLQPSVLDSCRKNGVNVSLPKPLTWSKLENFGLTREPIVTNEGHVLLEEFTVDGITAYSLDRQTFYVSNQGMCRRWMAGLDRIANDALSR